MATAITRYRRNLETTSLKFLGKVVSDRLENYLRPYSTAFVKYPDIALFYNPFPDLFTAILRKM
ncbi:MAG: hypothetical protein V7L01_22115 [Nostoc sp.]|uniref:hypothetical protein n=1 Tax=Nostoc sp. TaxID=1180 RepID=UPI002FF681C8